MYDFACPQCKTTVERKDLSNLCVKCTICTADQKKTYQFCWQCQKQWKGPGPRSDRCNNNGCINLDLELLKNCKMIALPQVKGVNACPSIRACPTCGQTVEHDKTGCKNVICPRCKVEFCFVCLKLKRICHPTGSPYKICPGGVAPRQTFIPVWHKK
ncbi:probable E3 ubiquitin-protein ligase RNF144A-A [Thunnus maccoyii]|uniref:probable E3 ubiquitin-protein ligase RNF144A-A n=1 Tax=Thunnus maccoyii TaxID=8240 RepID=UPI001C4CB204|nr:probable E3 ubiquitin-protein ligase RNF144A-A [Thunnus maccoyii]